MTMRGVLPTRAGAPITIGGTIRTKVATTLISGSDVTCIWRRITLKIKVVWWGFVLNSRHPDPMARVEARSRQGVEGHDRLDQVDPRNPGMISKNLFFDGRHCT